MARRSTVPGRVTNLESINPAKWLSWTPSVSSQTGSITTVGAVSGLYTRHGRLIVYSASLAITTNGTGATGIQFTLPVNALRTSDAVGAGRDIAVSGKMLQVVTASATAALIYNYDNSYPGASGCSLQVAGTYEAAID